MAEAIVSVALETIYDLTLEEARFLAGVGNQVKELERQLKEIKCFLEDADRRRHESRTVSNWISEIRDLAFQSQSAIERHAAYQTTTRTGLAQCVRKYSCILVHLHRSGSEISQITSNLDRIRQAMQQAGVASSIISNPNNGEGGRSSMSRRQQSFPDYEMGDCFIGMEDEVEELVRRLGRDTEARVISVWGMGGSGKTAIAKKLYHETAGFDLTAWVCITQRCDRRSVWEDVLRQLLVKKSEDNIDTRKSSDSELIERLREIQREKRCLIVMDDLWQLSHWDELKQPFIIRDLETKILVTTREESVAEIGLALQHGLLHVDDAFQLLKKKAFPQGNIPDFALQNNSTRFEEIGKEMVQKCGCLPLVISLLGGVLGKKNSMAEWESVNMNIKNVVYRDGKDQIEHVLNLSYESLPYYLKPCFLYMGILDEDETISVVRLYRMWIAQGMISHENIGDMDETLTDIAELYLSELVSRSIVQVEIQDYYDVASRARKYRSTCKLHDVVRELCLKLGKSEDFGLQILEYQGGRLSTLLREASLNMKILHLVIHFRSQVEHELRVPRGGGTSKHIRSLQLSNLTESNVVEFPQQSILDFRKFKLLRDLVIVRFKFAGGKLPRGITDLVHLRCLRLEACELDSLPPSIRNFVFMDTLDLSDSLNVEVPNAINELLRLKHLIFPPYGDETVGNYRVILDEGVDGLETLACVDSRYHELKCMDRMKNLQRFVAKVHDNESLSAIMNAILNWDKLMHCSLHIEASCDLTSELMLKMALTCPNLDEMVSRPKLGNALGECGSSNLMGSKLRCLDLVGSEIEDDPMGILGKLPCLIRLRFYSKSFIGEEMVCPANSFLRLKKLALMGLPRLSEWRVETGAMPLLSQLTLIRCNRLEMLPEGLSEISTLKSLVIKRMPEMARRVSPSGDDLHKVRHVPSIIIYK